MDGSGSDTEADIYQARSSKSCPRNCTCEEYVRIKKRSSKSVTFSRKHLWDPDELLARRQKLELMLSRTQIEESHSVDHHNELQSRFDRIKAVLEGIVHYVDCVRLEVQSSHRLCKVLNDLVVNDAHFLVTDTLTSVIRKLLESTKFENTNSISTKIYSILDADKDLENLFDDYDCRKRDFNTGLLNFKILLENMNLNGKELQRLQCQFEDVLLKFQHSRCLLDQELPQVTDKRLQVLMECLGTLADDLESIANNRSDVLKLFKIMSGCKKSGNEVSICTVMKNDT